jgi:hypothetical protein
MQNYNRANLGLVHVNHSASGALNLYKPTSKGGTHKRVSPEY